MVRVYWTVNKMSLELSDVLMITAIIVEGPIVWWLTSRNRKEDNVSALITELKNSIKGVHRRIDGVEDSHASKEYVDDKVEHVKEMVNLQFLAIMEELKYIRSRVDERSRKD